ncbi:MAG: methylenetetrahydrofolate reductase [Candidatus Omnitrophica bacterium]|nr:methylenetetrahydrofolate reductase [Candidatus Omnitrophota bacterium]
MSFKDKLNSKKFVVTAEVGPPKGSDVAHFLEGAELFKKRVDATNVTELQSAVMRLGSLAACRLLLEKGHEPILQMTCRDKNRLSLQSEALSAAALGIRNILVVTGDHPSSGDHPEAKGVFDLDSVQLLAALKGLKEGHDMAGNKLEGPPPDFFIGGAVNPGADPIEPEIMKLEKKVIAGVEFIQTQAVYEPEKFRNFIALIKHIKVPVLVGIVLLKSAGMARYMNKNVSGIFVPEGLIKEMEQAKDKKAISTEIGARIIKATKDICQGAHIMPLGWDSLVVPVIDRSGI